MKLILVVAVILAVQTKLSIFESTFIDNQIQEQDYEYENDNTSHQIVESSKGIRVSRAGGRSMFNIFILQ